MAHEPNSDTEEGTRARMQQILDEMVALHSIFCDRAQEIDSGGQNQWTRTIQITTEAAPRLSLRFMLDASVGYPDRIADEQRFLQLVFRGYVSDEMRADLDILQQRLVEEACELTVVGGVMVFALVQQAEEMIATGEFPTLVPMEKEHVDSGSGTDDINDDDGDDEEEEEVKKREFDPRELHVQLSQSERSEEKRRGSGRKKKKKKGKKMIMKQQHSEQQIGEMETGSSSVDKRQSETAASIRRRKWEHEIFKRIKWDSSIPQELVVIGYLDRFEGIKEIRFVDFKGVHDDFLEGIPLSRIRYFKLNGIVVWDRKKKIDLLTHRSVDKLLTGHVDAQADSPVVHTEGTIDTESPTVVHGHKANVIDIFPKRLAISVKRFSPGQGEWLTRVTAPERNTQTHTTRLNIATHNIMFDTEEIFADDDNDAKRNATLLKQLERTNADIIALQEVSRDFQRLLLDEQWVRDHYFVSDLIDAMLPVGHGLLVLSKKPPNTMDILWLSRGKYALLPQWDILTTAGKQRLAVSVVHLTSNLANNYAEKRKEQLFRLMDFLEEISADHQFIVGDFNFGDREHTGESNLLNTWGRDSWTEMHADLERSPGITFDPVLNYTAARTSKTGLQRRLDKIVYRSALFTTQNIQVIENEIVPFITDSEGRELHFHASDHSALLCTMRIKDADISKLAMKKVHTTAIAVVPPFEVWPSIQEIRKQYDSAYDRWPPHINLLYPFFEAEYINDVATTISESVNAVQPFSLRLDRFSTFRQGVVFLDSSHASPELIHLQQMLFHAFPTCTEQSSHKNGFSPHLTVAKLQGEQKKNMKKIAKEWQEDWEPIEFRVDQIYILEREKDTPFRVARVVPLGIPPMLRMHHVYSPLQPCFSRYDIVEDETSLEIKKRAFDALQDVIHNVFGQRYRLHAFGSYRMGVRCSDLDVVCLHHCPDSLPDHSRLQFFETMESALTAPSNLVTTCRVIAEAIVPALAIKMVNGLRVDLLYTHEATDNLERNMSNMDNVDLLTIGGIYETNIIMQSVSNVRMFQALLSLVKKWASNRGIYSNTYGFLGGISYAIMCAYVVRHVDDGDSHYRYDNGDMHIQLVERFFDMMASWDWHHRPLSLSRASQAPRQKDKNKRENLRILLSAPPHGNSARNVTKSTFQVVETEFRRAATITKGLSNCKSIDTAMDKLLQGNVEAFHEQHSAFIIVEIGSDNMKLLEHWAGKVESRLVRLCVLLEQITPNARVRPYPKRFREQANQFEIHMGIDGCCDTATTEEVSKRWASQLLSSTDKAAHWISVRRVDRGEITKYQQK